MAIGPASFGYSWRRELVAVEGRKIFTVGRCFRGDVLTAEAEGLFISIDMASYERLHVARDAASRGAR